MIPETTRSSRPLERRLLKDVVVILAASGFLTLSGAFMGDTVVSIERRFGYWLVAISIGSAWGWACARLLARWFDVDDRPWLGGLILAFMVALPLSVVIWAITGPLLGISPRPLEHLPHFILPVLAVTAILVGVGLLVDRRTTETHAAPPGAAPSRFLDRLPAKLKGARLIAVQAEDHYLRLHTDLGSDLILMRLSDALAELDGLEGAQTHRSWWVSRDAVRNVSRGDGRASLSLDGGLIAPVSRRHAPGLRKAGWY